MWKVHADILKMAKTEEKRQLIKWLYARRVFFDMDEMQRGLELARQCEHEDARFLVSLFAKQTPRSWREAREVLEAAGDDPRCWCWAAMRGAAARDDLMRRSAEAGYLWAMVSYCELPKCPFGRAERIACFERCAGLNDPTAMRRVAHMLLYGEGMPKDTERGWRLIEEAALLGIPLAQFRVAVGRNPLNSVKRWAWLRRAALQEEPRAIEYVGRQWPKLLEQFRQGALADVAYEFGALLAGSSDHVRLCLHSSQAVLIEELYQKGTMAAKRALFCWMWAGKLLGLSKDVRQLIGELMWEERRAWIDKQN